MTTNWLDSFYEALEFFYWEPQHIGRKKNVAGEFNTLAKVVKHLRKMEVTLNQNISQFLLLAPAVLRTRLFHWFFARDFGLDFEIHGRAVDTAFSLANAVQPDFLFVSNAEVISIEMKVGAKSSIEQVLKYALLGLAVEMREASTKTHYLGFLGIRDFANQWKEKFLSPAELGRALQRADLAAFLQKQPARFRNQQSRFKEIVAQLELGFLSYRQLAELLRLESPAPADTSPGAEVYRNLLSGIIIELERRELTG